MEGDTEKRLGDSVCEIVRTSVLFCWFPGPKLMIERDSLGHSYLIVRGEKIGPMCVMYNYIRRG